MNCDFFLDCPIDCYASKDCFDSKFLRDANPINNSCVGLRQGIIEIVDTCANSLHQKIGKKHGVLMTIFFE